MFARGRVMLIIYVDYNIITQDDEKEKMKIFPQKQFYTKDMGRLGYFLGIEVALPRRESVCHNGNMCWIFLTRLD